MYFFLANRHYILSVEGTRETLQNEAIFFFLFLAAVCLLGRLLAVLMACLELGSCSAGGMWCPRVCVLQSQ